MRELLNEQIRDFLQRKLSTLTEDEINLLGNTIYYIAFTGDMPEMKYLAYYSGLTPQKFTNLIQSLNREIWCEGLFDRASDRYRRVEKPKTTEFLCSLAAELVESGWWVDTPEEPESRKIARATIEQYISAADVSSRSEFRGYLVALEYVWGALDGVELKPKAWIRRRYGGSKSSAGTDVNAFLRLLAKKTRKELDKEAKKNPRVILGALKRSAVKQRHLAEEGYALDSNPTV